MLVPEAETDGVHDAAADDLALAEADASAESEYVRLWPVAV